jgi:hypothetical protein
MDLEAIYLMKMSELSGLAPDVLEDTRSLAQRCWDQAHQLADASPDAIRAFSERAEIELRGLVSALAQAAINLQQQGAITPEQSLDLLIAGQAMFFDQTTRRQHQCDRLQQRQPHGRPGPDRTHRCRDTASSNSQGFGRSLIAVLAPSLRRIQLTIRGRS